ncbi:MAG TPA: endonuclease/exonuclease/phosphatase family protein [Tepidisphaeraceae bacterium]|nr:endonuclease/exonuclease/phosphatase family protein [Tepidisphaeraceae bacterium]
MKSSLLVIVLLLCGVSAGAQEITLGTYNIEYFQHHFAAKELAAPKPSPLPNTQAVKDLLAAERAHEDKDNWAISQVILDPKFSPDILAIQEGCSQANLEYFAHHWLGDRYQTVIVFAGNSDREQYVEMLLKPGFDIIQRRDQYFQEKDPVANERGDKLFARGPAFLLIQAPGGYRFWVGTNHQKSKSGNSMDVSKWRNREAKRTHEIIKELEKTGPADVVFMGDMNDELWYQPFEQEAGGDAISLLVGPPQDGFILATRPLIEAGQISYFGYERTEYRSFIDQILVTRSLKDRIGPVQVFSNGFTAMASDHHPVMMKLKTSVR